MAKIIIGIHGLGNKPNPEILKNWWIKSIREGLTVSGYDIEILPFTMVYWADILHPKPESLDITDEDDPLFISEPYLPSPKEQPEKPDPESLSRKLFKYIEEQLDKIFLREDMTLNFNKVTDSIIHNYFKDLEVYYSGENTEKNDPNSIARIKIRERLLHVLKKYREDDILLLCHSMGSIISYDVLINNSTECNVNTMVTIGSPLGIPIIVSRIFAERKALQVPPNISEKWINISDPEDLVAMDHTLEDDFAVNQNNLKIQDMLVYNDYAVEQKRNPHKIYGYLRTPEMAQIIHTFLTEKTGFAKHYQNFKDKIINIWWKTTNLGSSE